MSAAPISRPSSSDRLSQSQWSLAVGLVLLALGASALLLRTERPAPRRPPASGDSLTLAYVAGCALEPGDAVLLSPGGKEQRFEGQFGLASGWKTGTMNREEQRWLTACLAARTNLFGRKVLVSMRGSHPSLTAGTPRDQSGDPWTIEEGAFYGDLFGDRPTTYACSGEHEPGTTGVLADRVCTKHDGGSSTTRCGFVYAGRCLDVCERDATDSFYRRCRAGADAFEEVITVHLAEEQDVITTAR